MINGLMEWSRNIVCFSIFSVLIRNLLPGEKYTPYIRLYMGFMMLLIFFTPILKILNVDATLQYLTEILGGTLKIEEDSFLASINENSNLERQKKEYTKRLEDSVVDYLTECMWTQKKWQGYRVEQAKVSWKEDEEDKEFGTLTEIIVYLRKEKSGEEKGELGVRKEEEEIWIEPVLIEVLSDLKEEEQETEESGQLKELLAQFYHLREEDITVRVIE